MLLAEDILQRLFLRGERARLSGSQRVVRELFKAAASAYWKQDLDQRDRMHATFARAADAGAVTLKWAGQGGDDRPLEVVVLRDLDRLAAFLGQATAEIAVNRAASVLSPWIDGSSRIAELLETWRGLKKVRTLGPESAGDFADALRVLDSLKGETEDRIARPLSVEVFGQSKRIEALYTHLDLLTTEALTSPARHWSEVLGAIGVRKEPQPFLLAGGGHVMLARGPEVPVAQPFVGVANHALTGFRGAPAWLLTLENLTTFHQSADLLAGADQGLLLFTGGMPSPSWIRAYTRVMENLPKTTLIYHWGDHDEGGFRIAARLAQVCAGAGRILLPWRMNAEHVGTRLKASEAQCKSMTASARRAGWEDLARQLPAVLLEQEGQLVELPQDLGRMQSDAATTLSASATRRP